MALNNSQHEAWQQILKLASNAAFKEGVAPGNVPAGTGLATLLTMYQTAEGGTHKQADQVEKNHLDPKQK